jgi:hypothetical protein
MADASLGMIARMGLNGGTILFVSPSAALVMGYAPDDCGTRTLDYTHSDDVEPVKAFFRTLLAEGPKLRRGPIRFAPGGTALARRHSAFSMTKRGKSD